MSLLREKNERLCTVSEPVDVGWVNRSAHGRLNGLA
jgi:hypothetical protein